jgi:hypothetical protein
MSKGNTTETDMLALIFNATALSWTAATNLQVNLHTADPGEAGTTATSLATYGGYAAVTVARTSGGWSVSGATASNVALIQFPQCSSGSNTLTHVSICPSGNTQILYSGALNSSLAVSTGIQPQFAAASLQIQED